MFLRSSKLSLTQYGIFFVLCLMLLTVFAGCAGTAQKTSTGEYIDDSVITAKVKAAIFDDEQLKVTQINVATFKGEVQLSGFVNSAEDVRRASEVARRVPGVKSVINSLVVK
ncbi:MAG: BON domain-containing protein [Nitrospirota bacterium]